MTGLLKHALHAAQGRAAPPHGLARTAANLLVGGAGGALGSAVLEQVLASRRFGMVRVLVTQALRVSLPGLQTAVVAPGSPPQADLADIALVVFDAKRHANGREEAFLRPEPRDLPMLAQWLHASGVRDLIV